MQNVKEDTQAIKEDTKHVKEVATDIKIIKEDLKEMKQNIETKLGELYLFGFSFAFDCAYWEVWRDKWTQKQCTLSHFLLCF